MKEQDAEKVIRKKAYVPVDDDYELSGLHIDDAENGVAVLCDYRLKSKVAEKVNKQNSEGAQPHIDSYCQERYVFETKQKAKDFIMKELEAMWGEGGGD